MQKKHQYLNLYTFSFKVDNVEFAKYLVSVKIHKDVTDAKFVEDVYIFDDNAIELLNLMLKPATITLSMNQSNSYKTIYSVKGIISKVFKQDNKIYLYFESDQKINWLRKNGISLTGEHVTPKDILQKFIQKIDDYYKHKKKTKFFFNYEKNINKYKYENILMPIKDNHWSIFEQTAHDYFLINAPFYLFLDDYDFRDKEHPVSVNVYDLTNIKALKAVMLQDLNTSTRPVLMKSGTYNTSKVFFDVQQKQKFNNPLTSYSHLKNKSKFDPSKRIKYNLVPDKSNNSEKRNKLTNEFFSKAAQYYKYSIHDIDVTKFQLGYRFVDNTSNAKIQFAQAIIDATFHFTTTGIQDVLTKKGDETNQMTVYAEFTTISS